MIGDDTDGVCGETTETNDDIGGEGGHNLKEIVVVECIGNDLFHIVGPGGIIGYNPVKKGLVPIERVESGFGRRRHTIAKREEIEEAARRANAYDFIAAFPEGYETLVGDRGIKLSGGQRQRVAIARSLMLKPHVMLFDEPTSALDPELVGEVLRVMRDLADEGRTMIIVTHEMRFAREVSSEIVFLHQGRIEEQGPPSQVFGDPRSERCRQFLATSAHEVAG